MIDKRCHFSKWQLNNWTSCMKKKKKEEEEEEETRHRLTPFTTINSKLITDLNVKHKL